MKRQTEDAILRMQLFFAVIGFIVLVMHQVMTKGFWTAVGVGIMYSICAVLVIVGTMFICDKV